jgi:hypothetical protein
LGSLWEDYSCGDATAVFLLPFDVEAQGGHMGEALAIVTNYEQLLQAIRARRDALGITHHTIDAVSGVADGYASKLLCDPPLKSLGAVSLGPVLGALGLRLIVTEDPDGFRRVRPMLTPRKRPRRLPTIAGIPWLITNLTARNMNKLRQQKLSAARRKQLARRAAKARWHKS